MFVYDKAITAVKRLTYTGNKSSLVTTAVNFECYLEPLDAEMSQQSGVQWGTAFRAFLNTGNDVVIGDNITLNTENYVVKGKMDYDQLVSHIELILVKSE